MEEYNKIYPELSKEPPKDGNAFRLQQSCQVLENLEKEAKHYTSVRKKYKRCYNLLSRISALSGTLSFCLQKVCRLEHSVLFRLALQGYI